MMRRFFRLEEGESPLLPPEKQDGQPEVTPGENGPEPPEEPEGIEGEEQFRQVVSVVGRLYPELLQGWGIPMEELEKRAVVKVLEFAEEDRKGFFEDIQAKGRTSDTEVLLRQLFGASDEDIEDFFAPPEPFKIPPEGQSFILPVEEGGVEVRKLALLKPDKSVWIGKEQVGVFDSETGEIAPVGMGLIEKAKTALKQSWTDYWKADFGWQKAPEAGNLLLSALGVGGGYLEKYVGRPWETAILEANARFYAKTGTLLPGSERDKRALEIIDEARRKYGWAAIFSEETSEAFEGWLKEQPELSRISLKVSEWLNPAYLIPIGGTFGTAARFTSKIPVLGKAMKFTAAGVKLVETGAAAPITIPLEAAARGATKGLEAAGRKLGEKVAADLIKKSTHLEIPLELPETEVIRDAILKDNWQRTALQFAAKLPPVRAGIRGGLGYRILVKRAGQDVEDIFGQGAAVWADITRRGESAAGAKYWELYALEANPVKFFGFNKQAYSPRMVEKLLPEFKDIYEAGTFEHVFTHPEMYELTAKEAQYITRLHDLNTEVLDFLKKEGVDPADVTSDWWVHRVVLGKFDPDGELIALRGRPGGGGRAIGGTPPEWKHRKAPTMAEGIAWGIKYDPNPEASLISYIEHAYKKVADARFIKYVEEFGETISERLVKRRPDLFERIELAEGATIPPGVVTTEKGFFIPKALLRKEELKDTATFGGVINRAMRGEKIPEETLKVMERRFPEWGQKLRGWVQEPVVAEKQLRAVLAQNEKTIKDLTAK